MQPVAEPRRLRPWAMWFVGALFFCYAFFQRVAPSVMISELMRDFNASGAILGSLSAFYYYAYAAVQLPTGVLADRWGPRRLLLVSGILSGIGSLMFATSDSLLAAYIGRLMIGGAAGFGFVCTLKIITVWFPPERLAMLSGLTMMIGMSGGVGGQAPLAAAVAAFGWRGTMVVGAALAFSIGIAAWVIIRDRPPGEPAGGATRQSVPMLLGLRLALRRSQTWIIAAYGFFILAPLFAFGTLWSVPYLMQTYDLSRPEAAGSASLMMVGWGVSAPIIGWISDRTRRRKPSMVIGAALVGLVMVVLFYVPDLPFVVVNLLLLAAGVSSAGMSVCFALVREHNESFAAGACMAFINMAVITSGAVLQPLVGWLLDLNWDGTMANGARVYSAAAFDGAFWIIPVCTLAAFGLALAVKETYGRSVVSA